MQYYNDYRKHRQGGEETPPPLELKKMRVKRRRKCKTEGEIGKKYFSNFQHFNSLVRDKNMPPPPPHIGFRYFPSPPPPFARPRKDPEFAPSPQTEF